MTFFAGGLTGMTILMSTVFCLAQAPRLHLEQPHFWQLPSAASMPAPKFVVTDNWYATARPKQDASKAAHTQRRSIWLWSVASLAAAATYADLATSHKCESEFIACREGNGLIPKSHWRADLLEGAISGMAIADSFVLERHHPKLAPFPALVAAGFHAFAALWAFHVRRDLAGQR